MDSHTIRNIRCGFVTIALFIFCINVAVLSLFGGYDARYGSLHLSGHNVFKPILLMNGCFILSLMLCSGSAFKHDSASAGIRKGKYKRSQWFYAFLISLSVVLLYFGSIHVNFSHHDWTHRHISAGLNSLRSVWSLFENPQADGFYRPLGFLSLWVDFHLFGGWYPGYHVQSIVLHVLNSFLTVWFARSMGFDRSGAWWTGLLFGVAAVGFEPVLWPAARFDLLSTAFTLAALGFGLRYFQRTGGPRSWELPLSHFCFVLGILSKESSYCVPLLVLFCVCTYRAWGMPRPLKNKLMYYFAFAACVTVVMVLIRLSIYGNLGGYRTGESHHFTLGFRTVTSLLKIIPLSIFGVNSTSSAPGWLPVLLISYCVFIFAAGVATRGCWRIREYLLLASTFIASIPVLNISGWIGSTMQHSRYLYLPTVFALMLMVSVLQKARRSGVFLFLYAAINAAGALASTSSYKDMLARAETVAESVRTDWVRDSAKTIYLLDLPETPNGIFYFGSELVEKIEKKVPESSVVRVETGGVAGDGLVYRWSNAERKLLRERIAQ